MGLYSFLSFIYFFERLDPEPERLDLGFERLDLEKSYNFFSFSCLRVLVPEDAR
jgi:hypothetical protein